MVPPTPEGEGDHRPEPFPPPAKAGTPALALSRCRLKPELPRGSLPPPAEPDFQRRREEESLLRRPWNSSSENRTPKSALHLPRCRRCLAVYAQTLNFDFVSYEQQPVRYTNHHVKDGFTADTLRWAFTGVHSSNWHPLTTLAPRLDAVRQMAGRHHLDPACCCTRRELAWCSFLALRRLTGPLRRSKPGAPHSFACTGRRRVGGLGLGSERTCSAGCSSG